MLLAHVVIFCLNGVAQALLVNVLGEGGGHVHMLAAQVEHFGGVVHRIEEAHLLIDLVHLLLHHGQTEQWGLGDPLGDFHGLLLQLLIGEDAVDQAGLLQVLGVAEVAQKAQLPGLVEVQLVGG